MIHACYEETFTNHFEKLSAQMRVLVTNNIAVVMLLFATKQELVLWGHIIFPSICGAFLATSLCGGRDALSTPLLEAGKENVQPLLNKLELRFLFCCSLLCVLGQIGWD